MDNNTNIFQNTLQGVPKLQSLTTFPNLVDIYGPPEELLIQSHKPALVSIVKNLGIRGGDRLRKFSLVSMIWLGLTNTNYAVLLEFLDSARSGRSGTVAPIMARFLNRHLSERDSTRQYIVQPNQNFRNIDAKKCVFSLVYYYHLAFINLRTESRNGLRQIFSCEGFHAMFTSSMVSVRRVIINRNLQTPSTGNEHRTRLQRRSTHNLRSDVTRGSIEKIPHHIKVGYIQLYSKINKEEFDLHECPICMESISGDQLNITNCGHFFHINCLSRIIRNICPTCRKDLY